MNLNLSKERNSNFAQWKEKSLINWAHGLIHCPENTKWCLISSLQEKKIEENYEHETIRMRKYGFSVCNNQIID